MSTAVTLPASRACGTQGSARQGGGQGEVGGLEGIREGKTFVEVDGTDFI